MTKQPHSEQANGTDQTINTEPKAHSSEEAISPEQEAVSAEQKAVSAKQKAMSTEQKPAELLEGKLEKQPAQKPAEVSDDNMTTVDTSDAVPRLIGFTVLTIVFGILIGWSVFAPLDSAAYAPGYVAVESYRKTIQHLEGGIVREILVKEGQQVKKGDILIILDDTQLKAQLKILEAQYVAALALSARLVAERDNKDDIQPDDYLLTQSHNPDIKELVRVQRAVFLSRKRAREGEIKVLEQRIEQLKEQINGLKEQQKSDLRQIKLYREEIVEFRALLKKGYTDKTRMRDMQRRVAELEGQVASIISSIAAAKIKIGETRLEIIQIGHRHQLEVAEQLSKTMVDINDLEERRLAIQDKISRTKIIASDDGVVLGLNVHTIGGVIAAGKPILEIVPQGEQLIVEAQVSPVDIDKVHVGLVSEIRFSAFKSATTPVVFGKVVTVSADILTDEKTGMPYYKARIKVTPESYKKLGNLKLLPGMPAETLIKIGERTLFEYLVQPATNAFARSFIED